MRLFEITAHLRSVLATSRFRRELLIEMKANPAFANLLSDFLIFRESARPDLQYNAKDAPYRHGDLKGVRHCHLIFGKRIITYLLDASHIYLASLTDHSAYDGHNPKIAAFIRGLGKSDFTPFSIAPETPAPTDHGNLLGELKALVYELSQGDTRETVEQLASGHLPQSFLHYAQMLPATPREVLQAFGTKNQMMSFATQVLDNTRVKEAV